nr:probable aminopeptidase NPEPL1 isoform X3 [Odocoileus virginianus texanus]
MTRSLSGHHYWLVLVAKIVRLDYQGDLEAWALPTASRGFLKKLGNLRCWQSRHPSPGPGRPQPHPRWSHPDHRLGGQGHRLRYRGSQHEGEAPVLPGEASCPPGDHHAGDEEGLWGRRSCPGGLQSRCQAGFQRHPPCGVLLGRELRGAQRHKARRHPSAVLWKDCGNQQHGCRGQAGAGRWCVLRLQGPGRRHHPGHGHADRSSGHCHRQVPRGCAHQQRRVGGSLREGRAAMRGPGAPVGLLPRAALQRVHLGCGRHEELSGGQGQQPQLLCWPLHRLTHRLRLAWGLGPPGYRCARARWRARHRLRCGPPAGALRPGLRGPSTEPGVPTWLRGGRPGGGRGEGLQEAQARVMQPPCPVTLGALPHFALINSKQLEDYTLR